MSMRSAQSSAVSADFLGSVAAIADHPQLQGRVTAMKKSRNDFSAPVITILRRAGAYELNETDLNPHGDDEGAST